MKKSIQIIISIIIVCSLTVGGALCAAGIYTTANKMKTQTVAERWAGESELRFVQLSMFFPADQHVAITDVYNFRYAMLDAFKTAALPEPENGYLFTDAWSTTSRINVSTDRAKTDVSVTAVGGEFFSFHMMNLVSGGYISDSDFMHDRVVIDRDLAWLLYGGTDLQGLEINVGGKPFIIAGVIDREQDSASKAAYTDGMGLYMSFDMYSELEEGASISCYEVVMPEAYTGFAAQTAEKSFVCTGKHVLQNTGRFSIENIVENIKSMDVRSVQRNAIAYPYWENAARIAEDRCGFLLIGSVMLFSADAAFVLCLLLKGLAKLKLSKRSKPAQKKTENTEDNIKEEISDI